MLKISVDRIPDDEELDEIELDLDGEVHLFLRPTPGQLLLVYGERQNQISATLELLEQIFDADGFAHIRRIIADPRIKDAETFLRELLEMIAELAADDGIGEPDPTGSSSASAPSRSTTGAPSTGASRRATSTRSSSPSRASSASSTRKR